MEVTARLTVAAITHRGSARDRNEDCVAAGTWVTQDSMDSARVFALPLPAACVLADGMGGHPCGDVAGRFAAERMAQLLRDGRVAQVAPALRKVNAEMFDLMKESPRNAAMGAVVAGILATSGQVAIFNVGDSRAYRVEADRLVQLSHDDSTDGNWKPGSLFARSGGLTQSLGGRHGYSDISPHLRLEPAALESTYLLCSDGVYEALDEEQLREMIADDLPKSATAIVQAALRHWAADNISVVLARLDPP